MGALSYSLSGKAALFGGTFDPPHLGHLAVVKAARDLLKPDERCVVMPTNRNPHRTTSVLEGASFPDRLAMSRLAFLESEGFEVSDFEILRDGVSYTIDTVRQLRRDNPNLKELFLIIGADNAAGFSRWKGFKDLLTLVTPVVVARPGSPGLDPALSADEQSCFTHNIFLDLPISSTAIRAEIRKLMLADGKIEANQLPITDAVFNYIIEHGLYRG